MDDIDKIGILGNLLDNAMEAAGKCRDNKSVALDIYTSNNNHFIVLNIQNTSETAPLKKGTRFLSTKKSGKSWNRTGICKKCCCEIPGIPEYQI